MHYYHPNDTKNLGVQVKLQAELWHVIFLYQLMLLPLLRNMKHRGTLLRSNSMRNRIVMREAC